MNTAEILKVAKSYIRDKRRWGQGKYYDEEEDRLCAIGAINKACGARIPNQLTTQALKISMFVDEIIDNKNPYTTNLAIWNDSHTHEEVMEAFDKAIEVAEKRELL